jgi:ABC-type lipoprotein export system ATPase subunit
VLLDGARVDRRPDADRARLRAHRFGFVLQDAALDATRTVLDNVVETALYRGEPRRTAAAAAHRLMERFGVDLRASHRPGQISGGQAQRIALCRALLAAPSVVLADEPTGNLDTATGDTVIRALREHAAGNACVVIATHDASVVAACDRRIALDGAL